LVVVDVVGVLVIVEFENDGPAWLGPAKASTAAATMAKKLVPTI
jgi:hypothetical protein